MDFHKAIAHMPSFLLLLLVEPDELERQLGQESILLVDLCKPETYTQSHIPGAVHLDDAQIMAVNKPAMACYRARVSSMRTFRRLA